MYNSKLQSAESEKDKASSQTDICQLLIAGIQTLAEAESETLKRNRELELHKNELEFQNEKLRQAKEQAEAQSETLKLNRELEMHKKELEFQNEKLRHAKDQAEVATEKYTELYDFAPSGNFTLSKEGKIVEINLSGSRMLGKERPDLIGSSLGFFVSEDSKSNFNCFLGKIFTSEDVESCEVIMSNGSNIQKYVHLTGIVSGKGDNCLVTVVDITGRELAEAEMQHKNEELQKINAEKDKLFSVIAHDLRGPFIGFLGMTELMSEGLSDMTMEEIQEMAIVMKNYANNLYRLLGNLLEWSRMQRGLTSLLATSFLLRPKITESMVLVIEAANKKEIEVKYDIPEDMMVFADGNMLSGIIRNLATNAVKFTPKGGSLTISAKTDFDNSVEVSIKDNGIGMNEKILNKLFRLGENVNRNGTEGEGSTGLGLIICKDFVDKHGGKLWVESEEGKGTTFYFTMPAQRERI